MTLNVKSEETSRLAKELAKLTGETITQTVTVALRERLARERRARKPSRLDRLRAIRERLATLRVIDARPADELLGYGPSGTFEP